MRFLLLILALAAYGAYSLLTSFTGGGSAAPPKTQAQAKQSEHSLFSADGLTGMATHAVASAVGVGMQPLPATGCSSSFVPATQVEDLLLTLPEGQRALLAKLMVGSSAVWSAQIYKGEHGIGLCFPGQEKLLVLPSAVGAPATSLLDQVSDFVQAQANP